MSNVTLTMTKDEAAILLDALRRLYVPNAQSYDLTPLAIESANSLGDYVCRELCKAEQVG